MDNIYRFSWLDKKKQKATINPINEKYNKCFQYDVTVTLNYEEVKKDPQRITKITPFINNYNWGGINFPSENDDWKKIEKNSGTTVLNVLYAKKEEMYLVYVSKYNPNRGKQVILLMISNGETQREAKSEGQRWYYLVVKKLSTLVKGMTSKHHGDFYCLNCFHSFATEKN